MDDGAIRLPTVAGQFYEGNPSRLRREIEGFLAERGKAEAAPADMDTVRAVVVPHAGYVYSGGVAARTMAVAKGGKYDRVVVIAPSHRYRLGGIAVPHYTKCRTPLGDVAVDLDAVGRIPKDKLFPRNDQPHAQEHALEVELPLIQCLFPDTPVVPLVCGQVDLDTAAALAEGLMSLWGRGSLWVVSSDFTHYGASFSYLPFVDNVPERLRELDLGAAERITNLDRKGFDEYIDRTGATICGSNPILVMLSAAERAAAGGERLAAKLIEYTTSGELTGDYAHSVSYAGIVVYTSPVTSG